MMCEKSWSRCVASELSAHVCHLVNALLFLSLVKDLSFTEEVHKPCVWVAVCFGQPRTIALLPVLNASGPLRWLTALERGIMCRLPMPTQPGVINSGNMSQSERPERAEAVRLKAPRFQTYALSNINITTSRHITPHFALVSEYERRFSCAWLGPELFFFFFF